jgi:hypothetical protein
MAVPSARRRCALPRMFESNERPPAGYRRRVVLRLRGEPHGEVGTQESVLASESFGPLNGIHACRFIAALIQAARLVKGSLGRSHILGGGSTGTFRLLSRRGPAADLALHVLGRSGASLRRLPHGSGWRMLLTGAGVRL